MNRNILYTYSKEQLQDLLDHSNSYSDILRKIGVNPKGGNPKILKKIIKEYDLNEEKLNENRQSFYKSCGTKSNDSLKIPQEEYFADGVPHHPQSIIKNLVKRGLKEYKCEICGISEWQGKEISLQLHHKNGKHLNNTLDNLQILCPNCHSQTDTFAGKKLNRSKSINKCMVCGQELKKRKSLRCPKCSAKENFKASHSKSQIPISREELKELIRIIPFVKIGEKFNITDNAIRKWCKRYNLPYRSQDIKLISDEEWEKI